MKEKPIMWTALNEMRRRRAAAKKADRFRRLRLEALETRSMLTGLWWQPNVGGAWSSTTDIVDKNNWAAFKAGAPTCANVVPGPSDDLYFYDKFGTVSDL